MRLRIIPASNSIYYNGIWNLLKRKLQRYSTKYAPLLTFPFPWFLGKEVTDKNYQDTWGGSRCFKGSECSALTTHMFILPDGKWLYTSNLLASTIYHRNVTTQSLKEKSGIPSSLAPLFLCHVRISTKRVHAGNAVFWRLFQLSEPLLEWYHKSLWKRIVGFPDPRCCFASCHEK